MRKLSFLKAVIDALMQFVLRSLNFLISVFYMCLPLWLFMLVMQMRDKNNKVTAISTFTKDSSEFQFIYPNYILVAVEPNELKKNINKKMNKIHMFVGTNKWLIIIGLLVIITLLLTFKNFR